MTTSFYSNIQEEELKNKVAADWFATYDSTQIIGNIDFAVAVPTHGPQLFETEYLLWAEAKKGTSHEILESFIQLILTIGKARTYEDKLPPAFLGAFDAEKIAFVPYHEVMDVFTQNDFNWNVTPSAAPGVALWAEEATGALPLRHRREGIAPVHQAKLPHGTGRREADTGNYQQLYPHLPKMVR